MEWERWVQWSLSEHRQMFLWEPDNKYFQVQWGPKNVTAIRLCHCITHRATDCSTLSGCLPIKLYLQNRWWWARLGPEAVVCQTQYRRGAQRTNTGSPFPQNAFLWTGRNYCIEMGWYLYSCGTFWNTTHSTKKMPDHFFLPCTPKKVVTHTVCWVRPAVTISFPNIMPCRIRWRTQDDLMDWTGLNH